MDMDMDMDMGGGTPWLDQPIMLHSSREDTTCDLTPEQCAFRREHWHNWYIADLVYGIGTISFFVAVIGLFVIGFWSMKLAPTGLRKQAWWQKLVAAFRFLAYRRWNIKGLRRQTPSLGVLLVLVAGFVFFFAMTLGPKPYYWPNTDDVNFGDSPPLATRAGWMALACLPFVLVLGSKANMIAACTGVSHERLIIFHSWASRAMFVLALIHTFPFVVYNIQVLKDIEMQWKTSVFWWTGVAALVPQAYLTLMSFSWIRNKFYEFFKATHLLAALLFVLFLFFHLDYTLTSWDYIIASAALYAMSFLYSQIRTYFEHGISRRATITAVSDLTLKITIPIENMTATPGQHVFLRFLTLGLHALTAHPFTICSSMSPDSAKGKGNTRTLTFYVRARGGITGRLAKAAAKNPGMSVPVLLDGPYGGLQTRPLQTYDRSIVVACGSGAGFSLPFVMNWILAMSRAPATEGEKPAKTMRVVLATREPQLVEWYNAALVDFLEANDLPLDLTGVDISVHLTASDGAAIASETTSRDEERDETKKNEPSVASLSASKLPIKVLAGRPDFTSAIREATLEAGTSVGIAVCGPASVLKAAQDEAAAAQVRILSKGSGAAEVYLHSEEFSW